MFLGLTKTVNLLIHKYFMEEIFMEEMRECKKHGLTRFFLAKGKRPRWKCRKCSAEAVQRRREKLKALAVEYKGGKCINCGYNKCVASLSFHHKNPIEKDFGIASGDTMSWEKIKKEIDKCDLLCINCHTELHWLKGSIARRSEAKVC